MDGTLNEHEKFNIVNYDFPIKLDTTSQNKNSIFRTYEDIFDMYDNTADENQVFCVEYKGTSFLVAKKTLYVVGVCEDKEGSILKRKFSNPEYDQTVKSYKIAETFYFDTKKVLNKLDYFHACFFISEMARFKISQDVYFWGASRQFTDTIFENLYDICHDWKACSERRTFEWYLYNFSKNGESYYTECEHSANKLIEYNNVRLNSIK